MNAKEFSSHLKTARRRVVTLQKRAERALLEIAPSRLMIDSLTELNITMEELRVADEELRAQAEELQASQEALTAERQRYLELFEFAPDGYVVTNAQGQIQEINQAARSLLNLKPNWPKKPLAVYLAPEARADFYTRLNRLAQLDQVEHWETRLAPRHSPPIDVEFMVAPAHDTWGQVVGLRWMIRDITQRKQAEAELRQSREQLRELSARLQEVREEERTQLARELHDELGQALLGLKMDLIWLGKHLPPDTPQLLERTQEMTALIDDTINSVRRVMAEMRPVMLDELGLIPVLEVHCQEFEKHTSVRCHFKADLGELNLHGDYTIALFRVFQEALTNVGRHAQATKVNVTLDRDKDHLILQVRDNGRGLTPEALTHAKSFGLMGMRERVNLLQGEIKIQGQPGQGTTVWVKLPLNGLSASIEGAS